jgi:hypothetical protein
MEQVISEVKVIETDDGFRIEIKGDKEKIKQYFKDFGEPQFWGHRGRHGRHRPWGRHSKPWHPMMWMHMAPPWASWDEEDEPKEA